MRKLLNDPEDFVDEMLAMTQAIDGGHGVLYLYGNYGGDRLNSDLDGEMAAAEGIPVRTVLPVDDVADGMLDRLLDDFGAERAGHSVHRVFVGEYATSLEMVGASISLLSLNEDLAGYLDADRETVEFAR